MNMICSECGKEVPCPNPHAVSGPTGIVWSCSKKQLVLVRILKKGRNVRAALRLLGEKDE